MLVHDGVLDRDPGGWRLTVHAADIAIPPTIQALLASRLERLKSTDRRVLEVASVIGTDFAASAVSELSGLPEVEILAVLSRLRRIELAQPTGTYVGNEPVWRFHHVLIRDVAYRRLLKSERADLHERLANWVEAGGPSFAVESNEVIARNLEAAHGYRRDLGLRDAHSAELAVRSARSYLTSARRALDRDELVSAGGQAARGAALAAADGTLHADLLLVGCEAFLSGGDVAAGSPFVEELERIAGDSLAPWAICYRCQLVVLTDPSRLPEADRRLQEAIDEFTRRTDAAGLAKAHRVRANTRARLGRIGDCEADLFEALIAARRGGDHRQITAALSAAPNAALWGPSPAPKAGGRCLDVVRMQRMTTAAPSLEATSLRCLAVLELLRGRPDKARSMLAEAHKVVAELGLRHGLMETELYAGIIELMVGDEAAAEPHFRTALEGLDALGVGADAGQAAALLARSVLAQGRTEEADRYAAESERIAGHNLKTAIAWRAVRAEILSAQARHLEAVAKAREAVAVASETDLVLDHADACLALSRVLAAAGDARAADRARRDAESLYTAKDAVFMLGRTAPATAEHRPPVGAAPPRRLSVNNRASRTTDLPSRAAETDDADVIFAIYSEDVVYEDHRGLRGDPITDSVEFREAGMRKYQQYPHVDWQPVAVRGERLVLVHVHWTDDSGNETASLDMFEIGEDELVCYHGRFDADDIEGACRELDRRYYAGEGAPYAESGHGTCAFLEAMWSRNVEAARRVCQPDFRWRASAAALKPTERSLDEFFDWLDERARQVSSLKVWTSAIRWLSPDCYLALIEIRGTGQEFAWSRIAVGEYRSGLGVSVREFEVEDEDSAFSYAESLITQRPRGLVVDNQASRVSDLVIEAFQTHDAEAAISQFSPWISYEVRRSISGDLTAGIEYLRESVPALLEQYAHFDGHTVAVRGDRLCLTRSRWWDDAGNEASNLHVAELGEDGLVSALIYFDGDDFWTAYRELERRYYGAEGSEFAVNGHATTDWVTAISTNDIEGVRRASHPQFRWIASPSALKDPERTVEDMFRWMQERGRQLVSQRHWVPVLRWLSPDCAVGQGEIAGVGTDGEEYSWNFLYVSECRDGLLVTIREFDNEWAAFAHAESVVAQGHTRLVLSNTASHAIDRIVAAAVAGDLDTIVDSYAEHFDHADHRAISGGPVTDRPEVRAAWQRITAMYNRFEHHTVAIRGDRLHLGLYRWSDDSGNQSSGYALTEVGDHGRIIFQDRFDEEAFDAAYRELETRYYAGPGAKFAGPGMTTARYVETKNRGDLDTLFDELSTPDVHIESHSRSVFLDRSAEEYRASLEELTELVESVREWLAAIEWVSASWFVAFLKRDAAGREGEQYTWTRIVVGEVRGGRFAGACQFECEDEDVAFAYAEDRVRDAANPLAVRNSAGITARRLVAALNAASVTKVLECSTEDFVIDDRRRMAGDTLRGHEALRAATLRVLDQFNTFDGSPLAVRGEHLVLYRTRWSDASGNESTYLHVFELGDGRLSGEVRFEEDDFEAAYRELESRYYAGEGTASMTYGQFSTEYILTMNRADWDTLFTQMTTSDFRFENHSRSVFPDRTADDLRRSFEELYGMLESARSWFSALRWASTTVLAGRLERQGLGRDGERYTWTRILVNEYRDGRLAAVSEFDADDVNAALAHARQRAGED